MSCDRPASLLIDLLDWPVDGGDDFLSRDARFLSAVGAGLLIFMGVNILLVVVPELEVGNFRVLKGSAIAIFSWFVVDSVGCCVAGVPSNAGFNIFFLAMLLCPLWLVARSANVLRSFGTVIVGNYE